MSFPVQHVEIDIGGCSGDGSRVSSATVSHAFVPRRHDPKRALEGQPGVLYTCPFFFTVATARGPSVQRNSHRDAPLTSLFYTFYLSGPSITQVIHRRPRRRRCCPAAAAALVAAAAAAARPLATCTCAASAQALGAAGGRGGGCAARHAAGGHLGRAGSEAAAGGGLRLPSRPAGSL